MSRSIEVHVSTYVTVDLSDIDTKDLVEELRSRGGNEDSIPIDPSSLLDNLHIALKLGQDEKALTAARAFVCAYFGVIL